MTSCFGVTLNVHTRAHRRGYTRTKKVRPNASSDKPDGYRYTVKSGPCLQHKSEPAAKSLATQPFRECSRLSPTICVPPPAQLFHQINGTVYLQNVLGVGGECVSAVALTFKLLLGYLLFRLDIDFKSITDNEAKSDLTKHKNRESMLVR